MEKEEKIEEVKEKLGEAIDVIGGKFGEIGEKLGHVFEGEKVKTVKPLVSSRLLFISVLDKIYLVGLVLSFVLLTVYNFGGDLSSVSYGFWSRVGSQILIMIGMAIAYFFCNWIYKCAAKTMLCVTKNEVYKETHMPFLKWERNIPLEKITAVQTFDCFWIFRAVVVFQYGKLPLIFWTWTNHEFKNKVNELITTDPSKVENEYEDKNILSKKMLGWMKYAGLALLAIIVLLGIVRFFSYTFSTGKKVPGTYKLGDDTFYLYEDGKCGIYDLNDDVTSCEWSYVDDSKEVVINYEYETYSYWSGSNTVDGTMRFSYDKDKKTLTKDGKTYTKVEE